MNLPPPIEWVKLFVGIGVVIGLTYIVIWYGSRLPM